IKRVGGTSAGAINAVLLGLNYSQAETKKILIKLNFKNFLDDSWGFIRDTKRLIDEYGWYKGDYFRKWIGQIIKRKTGSSESNFADVHAMKKQKGFRDMYFVGTNLSTRFSEVFSFEHTPRMCIADAVRISMSIPLFFASKRSARGDVYVDGGVINNYPVKLFDRQKYVEKYSRMPDYYKEHNKKLKRAGKKISPYVYNKETLGFRLDSAKEIAVFRDQAEPLRETIDDFFDYAWALVRTISGIQESMHLHSDDWHRTVYIDTLGVGTTDFDISAPRKNALLRSGQKRTQAYFKWFDDLTRDPAVNHPSVR
ncbi:MAG: patatin-like phospholipase family protein, partial [Nitrospiraceae bacterium]